MLKIKNIASISAHDLVEQFVQWNKIDFARGVKAYPTHAAFYGMVHTGDDHARHVILAPWYTDDHAQLTNYLLNRLNRFRPLQYKIVMNYFFANGQRSDLTAERFRMSQPKFRDELRSALSYMDSAKDDVFLRNGFPAQFVS